MSQLTMRLTSGDARNGVYSVNVPNPVAQMPSGTKQTVYYLFVASDNDDTTGTCNHTTTSQVYTMAVTSTGTANLPICSACTSDAQCGTGDECVRMGATSATFCLQACGSGCPTGYTCSATVVHSRNLDEILTAGHCVHTSEFGWARKLLFIPAYNRGDEPFEAGRQRHPPRGTALWRRVRGEGRL